MKKILLFTLIIAILSALPVSAATPVIKTDGNYYDSINDAFIVNGIIENEIGNVPMTLRISLGGEDIYVMQTIAKSVNGVVSYSFEPMKLPATTPTGTYTITVRSAFMATPFTDTYDYTGTDLFLQIIKDINAEISQKDKTGLLGVLETNKDKLIIDWASISSLTDSTYFASLMFDEVYTVPEALVSVSDNVTVQEALKKLRSDIKENLSMAEYFDIDTVEDSKAWFLENTEYYGYNSLHKIYEYLPAHQTLEFVQRVVPTNARTLANAKTVLEQTILLTSVQLADNTTTVSNILSGFPEYFNGFSAKYNSLNESNKGAVWAYLKGKSYETCQALVGAANTYAGTLPGGGDGGGLGGGTGSGNVSAPPKDWGNTKDDGYNVTGSLVPDSEEKELQLIIFKDLPETHWAYTPMITLYRRNVIAGYGDNTVKPDKAITRAEFVKILAEISAMPIEVSGDKFSDVPETHWAYKYIMSARRTGLVTGGSANNFNPDEKITREDMLVILQRAINAPSGNANFADMNSAASYAKGAIGYFSEKGIVNGMGDNMFMPKGNTTRAQACKILNLLYQ